MAFHHGERVFIKSGFHQGRRGALFARVCFLWYGVDFGNSELLWFYPWQIGHVFAGSPVDNSSTIENVTRAREIVAKYEKARVEAGACRQ